MSQETARRPCGVLETALWKKDVGRRLRFPGVLAQGYYQLNAQLEKLQEWAGRERGRGVREKTKSRFPQEKGFSLLLREKLRYCW